MLLQEKIVVSISNLKLNFCELSYQTYKIYPFNTESLSITYCIYTGLFGWGTVFLVLLSSGQPTIQSISSFDILYSGKWTYQQTLNTVKHTYV